MKAVVGFIFSFDGPDPVAPGGAADEEVAVGVRKSLLRFTFSLDDPGCPGKAAKEEDGDEFFALDREIIWEALFEITVLGLNMLV